MEWETPGYYFLRTPSPGGVFVTVHGVGVIGGLGGITFGRRGEGVAGLFTDVSSILGCLCSCDILGLLLRLYTLAA